MARIREAGGQLIFWCPGCKDHHAVRAGDNAWTWNGSCEAPTFAPSILVTSGHYAPGEHAHCWCTYNAEHPDDPVDFHCYRCHSFVREGRIEFLGDCSHALAGQTAELPECPVDWN
jgi:hypothetical protein